MLGLDVASAFDEETDEDFGVAVYGGYDGCGNGLRESLVRYLSGVLSKWVVE